VVLVALAGAVLAWPLLGHQLGCRLVLIER
jgi:hypothetical protein